MKLILPISYSGEEGGKVGGKEREKKGGGG